MGDAEAKVSPPTRWRAAVAVCGVVGAALIGFLVGTRVATREAAPSREEAGAQPGKAWPREAELLYVAKRWTLNRLPGSLVDVSARPGKSEAGGKDVIVVRCRLSSTILRDVPARHDVLRIGIPEFGISQTVDVGVGGSGFTTETSFVAEAPGEIHVEVDGATGGPRPANVWRMEPLQRGVYVPR